MQVAVDISLYPFDADYIPPIRDVIARLNTYDSIDVETNPMATQIRGNYDDVMQVLTKEMRSTFDSLPKALFTIKILNNPLNS